jgi:hypothetical protein
MIVTPGNLRIADLGGLFWDKEYDLACPVNKLGQVDLYMATHHGAATSAERFIANPSAENDGGDPIEILAYPDGSFTVRNDRNGFVKTTENRAAANIASAAPADASALIVPDPSLRVRPARRSFL